MPRPLPSSTLRSPWYVLAGALAAAAITVACPAPGQAATPQAPSATTSNNVYAAAGQVRTEAAVAGDFTGVGGKVTVDQAIGQDATVAGGAVDVRAPVGDDLRAAGGDITVASTVGGELYAVGGNVTLTPAASIAHAAVIRAGNISLQGRVQGPLEATGSKITIDGEIAGDARLLAEEIELGPRARIGGTLSYAATSALKRAEGATIAGGLARELDPVDRRGMHGGMRWEGPARGAGGMAGGMSFVAFLACAALFLLLAPRFAGGAAQRIRFAPWRALAAGVLAALAVPLAAMLLFVTLLGIPLGIVVMVLYPALLLAGFVVGVLFVGRLLAAGLRRPPPASLGGEMGWFALALLLALLALRIPFLGGALAAGLGLLGLGACVLEIIDRRRGGPRAMPPADAPPLGLPVQAG